MTQGIDPFVGWEAATLAWVDVLREARQVDYSQEADPLAFGVWVELKGKVERILRNATRDQLLLIVMTAALHMHGAAELTDDLLDFLAVKVVDPEL